MQGGLNQFANAPQYKANNNVALKNASGFQQRQSIPMARGPSAERIQRNGTPTGAQRRQPSRDNAPYATANTNNRAMGQYGPKIATTNTRLQRF